MVMNSNGFTPFTLNRYMMSKQEIRETKRVVKRYSVHDFVHKEDREVFKKLLKYL